MTKDFKKFLNSAENRDATAAIFRYFAINGKADRTGMAVIFNVPYGTVSSICSDMQQLGLLTATKERAQYTRSFLQGLPGNTKTQRPTYGENEDIATQYLVTTSAFYLAAEYFAK